MNTKEAKNLRVGDAVITYNGRYTQHGIVTSIEPHKNGGYWVTYEWVTNGATHEGMKRHTSVYLPKKQGE